MPSEDTLESEDLDRLVSEAEEDRLDEIDALDRQKEYE
jgi:hypothetical protein